MKADEIRKLYNEDGTLSKDNRDKFIVSNMNMVYRIAHKYYIKGSKYEFDDIVSYGTEGLIKAVDTYDVNKNYQFSTYAYHVINNTILGYIRYSKRKPEYKGIVLNMESNIRDNDELFIIDNIRDKSIDVESCIEIKESIDNIIAKYSVRDIRIFKLYLSGYDQCEISQDIGISQAQVYRILSKFKNELLGG